MVARQDEAAPVGPREAQNIATVRAFHEAIERGDPPEAIAAFLDDAVVFRELPNRLFPDGAVRDKTAALDAIVRGRKVLASQRYAIETVTAHGDTVAIELRWSGVLAVPLGTKSTGDTLHASIAAFVELRDGRIVAQRNYDSYDPF